jgi:dTDP-4-dehydrorhamnose 3,5-epimerase
MKVIDTALAGVRLIEPAVFEDARGAFFESYQARNYAEAGIDCAFVQDNVSISSRNVLRGLHIQHPRGQDKLVQVLDGAVFDVAVDVRAGSPGFGRWVGETLSAENRRQLFIPKGFAHGFCVLSERAVFSYKCSDFYAPGNEVTILWDDPDIGIEWPVADVILSDKDRQGKSLAELADGSLPRYEPGNG